jgi:hypothetical protein
MLNEVKHLGSVESMAKENEILRLRLQNDTVFGRRSEPGSWRYGCR